MVITTDRRMKITKPMRIATAGHFMSSVKSYSSSKYCLTVRGVVLAKSSWTIVSCSSEKV